MSLPNCVPYIPLRHTCLRGLRALRAFIPYVLYAPLHLTDAHFLRALNSLFVHVEIF